MVKVMYNDKLVYKVVIWTFFGISLWKEKVALIYAPSQCESLRIPLWENQGILTTFWHPTHGIIFTFKAIHNKAPEYICNLITVYESPCNLRYLAHDNLLLVEPKTRLVSYGDRAFCKVAPKLWNRLPRDIRHSKSINSFKCSLKTHLFKTDFNL